MLLGTGTTTVDADVVGDEVRLVVRVGAGDRSHEPARQVEVEVEVVMRSLGVDWAWSRSASRGRRRHRSNDRRPLTLRAGDRHVAAVPTGAASWSAQVAPAPRRRSSAAAPRPQTEQQRSHRRSPWGRLVRAVSGRPRWGARAPAWAEVRPRAADRSDDCVRFATRASTPPPAR
jgi:hypothetical protein